MRQHLSAPKSWAVVTPDGSVQHLNHQLDSAYLLPTLSERDRYTNQTTSTNVLLVLVEQRRLDPLTLWGRCDLYAALEFE